MTDCAERQEVHPDFGRVPMMATVGSRNGVVGLDAVGLSQESLRVHG
jgi:hypothetical protein